MYMSYECSCAYCVHMYIVEFFLLSREFQHLCWNTSFPEAFSRLALLNAGPPECRPS